MAYYNSFVYKFISLEFETYNNQSRGPELFRKECLRLEHLYFTKWAKNYLTEQNEADKNLLRLYEVHGRLQNSISSKWKAREHLDKVEHKHFAQSNRNNNRNKNELEENLLNTEAEVSSKLQKIKELEAKAVKAANEYRRNSNNKEFLDEYNKSGQKLNGALYTLADMIGEAENARVQLFEILPSVERIKRLLSAMENEANMCN
ncbi:polymorphic mucin-like protein isoform 1 [Schistosoma japonicum]|uniref:Polymorphic mucin-like protein isoform 1 n=1 Tax=Schistosoma japonicum TaxID=6182 RepID=A0A4Z2CKY2_SCHJA|nr:polymorphic mucin-like protein isoform 1 [Schistosoma japonicum]